MTGSGVATKVDSAVGALMGWPARWLMQPGSPVVLALLRIAVFGGLVWTGLAYDPRQYARLPQDLILEPDYGGALLALLPINVAAATVMWVVMMAGVLALLGWRVRLTGAVAVVAAVYVFGLTAMFGKVDHNHHLLWLGAVLALSPSADALALDARGRPTPQRSAAYGFPLRVAWGLIGLIYFGAGLPKLASGLGWAFSDNVRNHMWIHWHVLNFTPPFRFDNYPALYQLAGLGTLIVEVGFVFALLWTISRRIAVGAGLAFHVGTQLMLGIFFPTLVACYVAFLPSKGEPDDRRPGGAPVVVGLVLLTAVALAGVANVPNGWPIASYPAFYRTDPEITTFAVLERGVPVTHGDVDLKEDAWRFLAQRVGREPGVAPALAKHLHLEDMTVERTVTYPDPDATVVVSREQVWPTYRRLA